MTQNSINNTASIMDVDNLRFDGNTISSTDTNGNVILDPDGTGSVSITTSALVPNGDRAESLGSATNSWDNLYCNGLTFDDGSNVMENYEDNITWTPVIEGFTTPGVGTYSQQLGGYSRIGKMVYLYFQVTWSAHTGTGIMTIAGLPYSIRADPFNSIGTFQTNNSLTDPATMLWTATRAYSNSTTTEFFIQGTGSNPSVVSYSISSPGLIRGSMIYFVD